MINSLKIFFVLTALMVVVSSCSTVQKYTTFPEPKSSDNATPTKKSAPDGQQESKGKAHKVAILLPLSGSYAPLGKGLLNAAELALFEANSSSVALMPKDTAKGAHQAAVEAINEGAELILGPVFAEDVNSVKPAAKAKNVNVIAFSTDRSVAATGTYILGLIPTQQIQYVIDYAKENGMTKIAAITPSDTYGKRIDDILIELNSKGTIQLLGVTHYSKGDILEGNPGNERIQEDVDAYLNRGLQALVIPEGGENLYHILNVLKEAGPLTILGSGQWDTPDTLKMTSLFHKAYFSSTMPEERKAFEARYQQAYGQTPPRLAALAYDAAALAVILSEEGYSASNLTNMHGFNGVEGLFRLTPHGLNERAFAVISVTSNGFEIKQAAPKQL